MQENNIQENNKTKSKKSKSAKKRRRLLTIIVLLLLCVAAAVYIIAHFGGSGSENAEAPVDEAAAAEEAAEAEAAEEAAKEKAAIEKAASHVYSYKGSSGDDELTMAAYDRAVEAGSKYLEADMVVSASGTIYLASDDQAFDMTGYNGFFSGMTDGQIDALETRNGNKIIRLKDLFDKYGDSVTYLVDIKYSSSRNIEAFTNIVKEYGFEKNVIAVSSYFNALSPLDAEFPDMEKLYYCQDAATFSLALGKDYVDIISVPADLMTSDYLEAAHGSNKKFSVWTLDSEKEISEAIELGVDSYFTDDTALAIKLEKDKRN